MGNLLAGGIGGPRLRKDACEKCIVDVDCGPDFGNLDDSISYDITEDLVEIVGGVEFVGDELRDELVSDGGKVEEVDGDGIAVVGELDIGRLERFRNGQSRCCGR